MKNSLSTSDSTTASSSSTYSSVPTEGKSQPPHGSKPMARRMVVMLGLMLLFIVVIGA